LVPIRDGEAAQRLNLRASDENVIGWRFLMTSGTGFVDVLAPHEEQRGH
jgi:hypothetical protein